MKEAPAMPMLKAAMLKPEAVPAAPDASISAVFTKPA